MPRASRTQVSIARRSGGGTPARPRVAAASSNCTAIHGLECRSSARVMNARAFGRNETDCGFPAACRKTLA